MEKLRILVKLAGDLNHTVADIIAAKADGVFTKEEDAKIWADVEQLVADAKAAAKGA